MKKEIVLRMHLAGDSHDPADQKKIPKFKAEKCIELHDAQMELR